jgi:hypothetical protein
MMMILPEAKEHERLTHFVKTDECLQEKQSGQVGGKSPARLGEQAFSRDRPSPGFPERFSINIV